MPYRKTISNTFVVNSVDDAIHAAVVELSISTILYNANSNGVSTSSQAFRIEYALKLGNGESVTISSASNVSIELPQGVTLSEKRYNSCDIVIANGATISNGVISITLEGVYGNETYSATGTITVSPNKQGIRGVAGRMPYFAGVWESIPNDQKFIVSDTQVPYFEYTLDGQINHALYDGNNSTYTKLAMTPLRDGRPDTFKNGTPWKIMTDDFQYLITKAIFAKVAEFGGGIVSGDWVISKYGTLYSEHNHPHTIDEDGHYGEYTINNAYTKFDASNPYSHVENVMNFIPKFALDLRTGRTYQHDTFIEGHIVATSGRIGGFDIETITDEVNGSTPTLSAGDDLSFLLLLNKFGITFKKVGETIFAVGSDDNIVAAISAKGKSPNQRIVGLQLCASGTAQSLKLKSALDITGGVVSGLKSQVIKLDSVYSQPFSGIPYEFAIVSDSNFESNNLSTANGNYPSVHISSGATIIVARNGQTITLPQKPENGTFYKFIFDISDDSHTSIIGVHRYPGATDKIRTKSANAYAIKYKKFSYAKYVYCDGFWYFECDSNWDYSTDINISSWSTGK